MTQTCRLRCTETIVMTRRRGRDTVSSYTERLYRRRRAARAFGPRYFHGSVVPGVNSPQLHTHDSILTTHI
jgi:hypothetical protein